VIKKLVHELSTMGTRRGQGFGGNLVTLRFVLVFVCILIINGLIGSKHIEWTPYVLGSELILAGVFMIYKWEWTAEFIRVNLLRYPFIHYFLDKNMKIKKRSVLFGGVLMISFGLLLVIFGPNIGTR